MPLFVVVPDFQQAVRLAVAHARCLDSSVAAMAAQAWVGGGAPGFAATLAQQRRALVAALESALAVVARSCDPTPPVPSLGSSPSMAYPSAGSFAGVDVARLNQLISGLSTAGSELPAAGQRLVGLGAPSGATVGAIGDWAATSARDLRRRLTHLQHQEPTSLGSPGIPGSPGSPGSFGSAGSLGPSGTGLSPSDLTPSSLNPFSLIPSSLVAFELFGAYASTAVSALLTRATTGDPAALTQVLTLQRQGTDPTLASRVNAWWRTLEASTRDQLTKSQPSLIGALDGIPITIRDQANRAFLASEKIRLAALLTVVPADMSIRLTWPAILAQTRQRLEHIQVIEQGLAMGVQNGRPPAYLIAFDTRGLGQATASFGNPDTANRVVTYVPGLNTKLATFSGDFNRAAVVWDQSHYLAPGQQVASIAWLGYRPPQLDLYALEPGKTVATSGAAALGAIPLASFTDGLHATHTPSTQAHLTMLGHSYGSLVTGKAAVLRPGRMADDFIFVGSPGVGVHHAEDLGVPASRVWVGEAAGDPVADLSRFTTDPSTKSFGARRFQVEPGPFYLTFGAHSIYWDDDSESLRNLALIATGQTDKITTVKDR